MVFKESNEESGRKFKHIARRCRPDGCPHRNDVVVLEGFPVVMLRQVGSQRHRIIAVVQECRSLSVKTHDVLNHPEKAG